MDTPPLDPSGGSEPHDDEPDRRPPLRARLRAALVGPPRDLKDRAIFRHISLIAFLAWVGLGADGLSSSTYGPEEAFRTLGAHTYLAVGLAALIAFTVLIISSAYSRIIERFPARRRGLHRGHHACSAPRRRRGRQRAARRLRPDHHHLDRRGRRRHLQPAADRVAGRQGAVRGGGAPRAAGAQHAGREGVGARAHADLPAVRRYPCRADRRCGGDARGRICPTRCANCTPASRRDGTRSDSVACCCSSCTRIRWAAAPTPASKRFRTG